MLNLLKAKIKILFSYKVSRYTTDVFSSLFGINIHRFQLRDHYDHLFGHIGRVRHYLAMTMVILCARSQVCTLAMARFSPPNMPYILNLFRISLCGEAINYRSYVSPSFEVASHVKKLPFRPLLLLYENNPLKYS